MGGTIDKEKIDRKWPASSGRQFCVVLKSLNLFGYETTFYWRMPSITQNCVHSRCSRMTSAISGLFVLILKKAGRQLVSTKFR